MDRVMRTVVAPSAVMSRRKYGALKELEGIYEEIVSELVDYGFRNNLDSFTKLKKFKYRELRK